MTPTQIERYARHLVLKEIGGPGQNKLLSARIVIIGAGGLGGPAALYAAAAGIGHITLIDDDVVDLSNLQRQIQFTQPHIGQPKAASLKDRLTDLNSDLTLKAIETRLTDKNAEALLSGYDLILDGTDSFAARFAINQASYNLRTPLLSGALGRFNGQISLFNTSSDSPCYHCLVPDMPPNSKGCAEIGVIGALAGVVGSMMALEAIKFITSAGENLAGKLFIYNGLNAQSRVINLPKDPACPVCRSGVSPA